MNRTTPKKIMEIIFIFIIPLLVVLANCNYYRYGNTYNSDETSSYFDYTFSIDYENPIILESPIADILQIPFDLLGFDIGNYRVSMIIDYTTLWFTMFIIWHLLYLFFDTLMHKVLLRKE